MKELTDARMAEIEGGDFFDGFACGVALAAALFEPSVIGELAAIAVCGDLLAKK